MCMYFCVCLCVYIGLFIHTDTHFLIVNLLIKIPNVHCLAAVLSGCVLGVICY